VNQALMRRRAEGNSGTLGIEGGFLGGWWAVLARINGGRRPRAQYSSGVAAIRWTLVLSPAAGVGTSSVSVDSQRQVMQKIDRVAYNYG
jgi:hypothetical protein